MGRTIGPEMLAAVQALYRDEQDAHAVRQPPAAPDVAYGTHPRHRLDLYPPQASGRPAPILLWVHGGGFVRGEKSSPDHPYNAHAGRWAARSGMLGAVMNYRLAPEAVWPEGGEDVGAAIAWLKAHGAANGGDPERIVAVGTSAGAVHVATHLQLAGNDSGLAGAVLLSGLYGFAPLEARDECYYGAPELYAERAPGKALTATNVPLFLSFAEYDPPRFQAEALALLAARVGAQGHVPHAHIAAGHNHFSAAYHLGTSDTRLADEILAFISDLPGA